jgi:hypothetical protein
MKSGTRPAKHIYKEKKFQHFAGVLEIPDFNLDSGLTMPDQEKDGAPYECVGYTTADILSDIFKTPLDPDFSYAAARYVAGDGPEGTQGTSFHAGLQGAIAVGALLQANAIISAAKNSEAFVSDWNNWLPSLRQAALPNAQNGLRNVLGQGDDFDSILSALYTGRIGVSIGSPWFEEWGYNIQGGVVQLPSIDGNYPSWHNYAAKGKKTINGIPHLIMKSWQGTRVGDNGWLYFSRETVNAALSVPGSGALTIARDANRWASLWGIVAQRFPMIVPLLPQLLKLQ